MDPLTLRNLTIRDLQRLYRARELSPVEVLTSTLDALDKWEPALNAFITILAQNAMSDALQAERTFRSGEPVPALTGVPVTTKDLFFTAGTVTTCGSRILADFTPDHDATAIARLRNAGAVLFGKTNALEFAYGVVHPDYGQCNNPWDASRTAGGSSSGSAASLAAGIGLGSLGTDTGGSIRVPASYCGIVGLKPTYGRISRHGVFPLSWSIDHVGPMARTVTDVAILLESTAGWDPSDPTSSARPVDDYTTGLGSDVSGLRVGLLTQHAGNDLVSDVAAAFSSAVAVLRDLGLSLVDIEIPELDHAEAALLGVVFPEAASVHERWLHERAGDYAAGTRDQLELGVVYPVLDYLRAQRFRTLLRQRVNEALALVDVLISPTVGFPAPDADPIVGDPDGPDEGRRTVPFSLTGHPAVTVPCGFTSDGLPVGLQLAGKEFDERTLLQVAGAYERETGWTTRGPRLPGD